MGMSEHGSKGWTPGNWKRKTKYYDIYIYIYIILEKYRNIFEKRLFSASSMTNPDVYRLNIRFCWLNPHLAFRNPYAYLSIQSKQTSHLSIYLPPYPTLPYPTLPYPTLPYLSVCSIYLPIYISI